MRVALVHDYLTQFGGAERVLKAMADMFPRAPIFTLLYDSRITEMHFPGRKIIASFLQRVPFIARHHRLTPPLMPYAVESFDFSQYRLVLSSSAGFTKGVVTGPGTVHINYCHTPLRYVWDDAHRYIEEFHLHPLFIRRLVPLFLHYIRVWDRAAAMRPDVFIANSRFVASRIKKYYGRDSEIIYPPVGIQKFEARIQNIIPDSIFHIPDSYFLMVGRLVPYKRFDLAIRVFNELGWRLLIVGVGPEQKKLRRIAGKTIEFAGYVSDERLGNFYRGARATIFPQEEDFGIVAVEAMAAGKPVIAYRGGGALETVREGETGLFFDEQSPASLREALLRFNAEFFDSEAIREHARLFSEEAFKSRLKDFIIKETQH